MNKFDEAIHDAIDAEEELLNSCVSNTLRAAARGEQWAVELIASIFAKTDKKEKP